MRYLMLVLSTPDAPAEPENVPAIEDWVRDTYDTGRAVLGDRLRPPADAVGVQVRAGEVVVTDGPFSETKGEEHRTAVVERLESEGYEVAAF